MWSRNGAVLFRAFGLAVALWAAASARAQQAEVLPQVNLRKRGAPPANYSGITRLAGDCYALVSDKEPADGYYPLRLQLDSLTGRVRQVQVEPFRGNPSPQCDAAGLSVRDCEGVAYFPDAETLFISGEGDQAMREYGTDGVPTGRQLAVPPLFALSGIHANYGFEALTYDTARGCFWTTTESTLRADGAAASPQYPQPNLLRLQSFGRDLRPATAYAYLTDRPEARRTGRAYAFGVAAMTALPDGGLLVLEREFFVARRYWGSWVTVKIYRVEPGEGLPLSASDTDTAAVRRKALPKQLVASWTSRFNAVNTRLANYEGMCLGPCLADGRQTLVLVSDSQGGAGRGPYRLKDYLRVLLLPPADQ